MARKMNFCCGEGRCGSNLERKGRTQVWKFPGWTFWSAGGRWQAPGSRGLKGWPLTWGAALCQTRPVPASSNGLITGQNWAHQELWWHLCGNLFKKRGKGFFGGCFTSASASSNYIANLSSPPPPLSVWLTLFTAQMCPPVETYEICLFYL